MWKSWKTTLSGLGALVTVLWNQLPLLWDGDPTTNPDYNIVVAAIIAAVGLFLARDNDKDSEAAGAK